VRVNRWAGEELRVTSTTLGRAADLLPTFTRAPLSIDLRPMSRPRRVLPPILGGRRGIPDHKYLDAILLNPDPEWPYERPLPIALVSKQYSLIQHRDLVVALTAALGEHVEHPRTLPCDVALSEYGGRMKLTVKLPSDFRPPDGEPIVPTLECLNSVDRSRPLQVYLGWFRFICSNGLIIGEEFARMRRRHVRSLELDDIQTTVSQHVSRLARDAETLSRWWDTPIGNEAVRAWVDGLVAKEWGVHAAARVLHITRTGRDCRVTTADQRVPPSTGTSYPETRCPAPRHRTSTRTGSHRSWPSSPANAPSSKPSRRGSPRSHC
jgi:hypothetical protein